MICTEAGPVVYIILSKGEDTAKSIQFTFTMEHNHTHTPYNKTNGVFTTEEAACISYFSQFPSRPLYLRVKTLRP